MSPRNLVQDARDDWMFERSTSVTPPWTLNLCASNTNRRLVNHSLPPTVSMFFCRFALPSLTICSPCRSSVFTLISFAERRKSTAGLRRTLRKTTAALRRVVQLIVRHGYLYNSPCCLKTFSTMARASLLITFLPWATAAKA